MKKALPTSTGKGFYVGVYLAGSPVEVEDDLTARLTLQVKGIDAAEVIGYGDLTAIVEGKICPYDIVVLDGYETSTLSRLQFERVTALSSRAVAVVFYSHLLDEFYFPIGFRQFPITKQTYANYAELVFSKLPK